MALSPRARQKRRLLRQFAALERRVPPARRLIRLLVRHSPTVVRLPVAVLLVLGGLFSVLPFLGLWMLPLGLLLLAVDLPTLRPGVSALIIRSRRWTAERLRRVRRRAWA
ncbi:tryptophan synthase subunit beta [Rubellimicrobium aerolatum]|uniref:Tryptophan synthase subunit beta n=1 Tax=Rubellimicrobium aerolatum TaxID=490979 RepID=A0ABW0SHA0_9RHOB|nr:tryptophan synthase subunit beta [Rubellimicrobium aerolatum]MBP1807789.1 hypothetical protein [Rubellimicrobium aerolatum]